MPILYRPEKRYPHPFSWLQLAELELSGDAAQT
jgi:hypothetical protein